MSTIHFKAPWARPLRIKTMVAIVTLLIFIWLGAAWSPHLDAAVRVAFAAVPALALLAGLSRIVRGYRLTESEIVIKRLFTKKRLTLSDLQTVEGKADAMQRALPLLSTYGFFAYAGWYWKRRIGIYHAYATDPSRAVILHHGSRKTLITPHDPQQFIARARTLMKTIAWSA